MLNFMRNLDFFDHFKYKSNLDLGQRFQEMTILPISYI